jgi:hypothetical protein
MIISFRFRDDMAAFWCYGTVSWCEAVCDWEVFLVLVAGNVTWCLLLFGGIFMYVSYLPSKSVVVI